MERTSIFRLFRCWLREFGSLGFFILDNENVGRSIICIARDLLPEEATVTNLATCQGRDHFVNTQSGKHNFVIVNVHFELEVTLRQLRGRLHLIHPRWPAYPCGVGVILGDFNICDREEGRFNVWNQSFNDDDPGKIVVFHSFFLHVFLISREETFQTLGSYALFQGYIVFSQFTHG